MMTVPEFLHQHRIRLFCATFAAALRSLHLRQRPARHDVRFDHIQCVTPAPDIPVMKKSGFRASYAGG